MRSIRHPLSLLAAVAFFLSLTACNTWSGFGKDLQEMGKNIQRGAEGSSSSSSTTKK
jgi:predicted small secreted protein